MDVKANRQLKLAGFTLIEILVVIFIIALITSVVLLKGINTFTLTARSSASRLVNVLQLAELEAILNGETLRFEYNSTGYQFLNYKINPDGMTGTWLPVSNNRYLRFHPLPYRVSLSGAQTIIIFPDGECLPFTLSVMSQHKTQYLVVGNEACIFKMVQQ